jgi:hypothetical protein
MILLPYANGRRESKHILGDAGDAQHLANGQRPLPEGFSPKISLTECESGPVAAGICLNGVFGDFGGRRALQR